MIDRLLSRTRAAEFRERLGRILVELCAIDTTPNSDVSAMRKAESAAFDIIERELKPLSPAGARLERRPVNPAIKSHLNYSLLHFTKTPQRPEGLSPEAAYEDRCNLLCVLSGDGKRPGGIGTAVNAHIDVVSPYIPPRLENGVIFGRGACDDKGGVVAIVGALQILADFLKAEGRPINRNVVAMFVVEEETGGNGSLSLAVDRDLKKLYDSALIIECAENRVYPANRGAVWYAAKLAGKDISLFEMAAFVVEEMEKEGRSIRTESRHNLFPQRPVQTCHGKFGQFGEHPSRICGEISFEIRFDREPDEAGMDLVRDCMEFSLEEYVGRYGDRTKTPDPITGKPKVAKHYDIRRQGRIITIDVHGSTGHMGAIFENDGAITKMSYFIRALIGSRARLEKLARCSFTLELAGRTEDGQLILEGGQGFVPTHGIKEVMSRIRRAAERGAEAYLRRICRPGNGEEFIGVTYEKLHNAAFDGNPDSVSMKNAIAAQKAVGLWKDQPVIGWTVSCDARLFATEYPGMDVLTTGPGKLSHAHSDAEQLSLDELVAAAEFIAVYLLRQTGTID